MSQIQWFPGHMAKARREASEKLKLVDVVIELIDARLPQSSRNPLIDELAHQKKRLVIFNKQDLADAQMTDKWVQYFNQEGLAALSIAAKDGRGMKAMQAAIKDLMQEKFAALAQKGVKNRPIRVMILGIPNVGKSTLINRFINKNKAVTGNRPGVTKGQQWLKLGDQFELLDTPGILWPKFEDVEIGKKLALTGAIKDTLIPLDDVAIFALDYFAQYYPERLKQHYHLTDAQLSLPPAELFIALGQLKHFADDYHRLSELLIQDVRQGRLGRYTLDQVPSEVPHDA